MYCMFFQILLMHDMISHIVCRLLLNYPYLEENWVQNYFTIICKALKNLMQYSNLNPL